MPEPRYKTYDREPEDLEMAVHTSLGTASVAWENMSGTGVFNDTLAAEAGEDLITWINDNYDKKGAPSA